MKFRILGNKRYGFKWWIEANNGMPVAKSFSDYSRKCDAKRGLKRFVENMTIVADCFDQDTPADVIVDSFLSYFVND